jgi:hypothetical protein
MLVRLFIQHRGTIIHGHEDDRESSDNANLIGSDFASHAFEERSVPLWLYGWLLSYKVECPVIGSMGMSDARFSANAMTTTPQVVADCQVVLEEAKLGYLQRAKAGSLRRAEFAALTADEIASRIRSKLSQNYIYNLARADDHETLKFNIVLEIGHTARVMCALQYFPRDKTLRVITLY